MIKFILLILISLNNLSFGAHIVIDDKKSKLEILSSSEVYLDKTKLLTVDEIQQNAIAFESNEKVRLSFGYSPDFNVWVKFTLKNTTNKRVTKLLEYANPLTTHINLYDPSNNRVYKDGLFQINPNRKTINPFFKLNLEPHEVKTFYLKASSNITTMIVQLKIWEEQDFYNHELKHQSILQLFFGAMLILALYNLFVYFFTKDLSYLFYVLYIIGISFHQSIYVGVGSTYLYSQDIIINIILCASLLVAFPSLALGLFTKYFINTIQYPKINLMLNIFLFIVILNTIYFYIYPVNQYRNLLPSLFLLFLMGITIYAFFKRNKQALFILFGWIIFTTSGIFMYLSSIGILNIFINLPYYIEVGLLAEAIIFSIALSNQINHLQYQRDTINKKLILQKETEKERLKVEVKIKTKELQKALNEQVTLLQELNHRVKNNMQTIISLVRLQADEVEDKEIQEVFVTIENRISAMSYLHELLYKKSDISYVNTYEYFEILIDNLQSSFEHEIHVTYNINVNLQIEEAISCGLILNELITNSCKYAFDDNHGSINVELYQENEIYYFNVSDTGKGYDTFNKKNSFGLVLVSTLVKNHLEGSLHTTSKNGVTNKIIWSKHF